MSYLLVGMLFLMVMPLLGFGAAVWLLPKSLLRNTLYFSPLLGYCALSLFGWYGYRWNLPGTDAYAYYVLGLLLLLGLLSLRKLQKSVMADIFNREALLACALTLLIFIIVSIPFWAQTESLTSRSFWNNDIADSASVGTFLKEFQRSASQGFLGQSDAFRAQADTTLFGGPLLSAFLASVFGLQTFQIQSMTVNVFFSFGCLVLYFVLRNVFGYGKPPSLVITLLFGLHPVLLYTVYNGFQGQIIGQSLMLGLLGMALPPGLNQISNRQLLSRLPVVALLGWGLLATYNHMLPVVVVLLMVMAATYFISSGNWSGLIRYGLFAIVALCLMSILSLTRAKGLVGDFLLRGTQEAGWHMPEFLLDVVFGFTSNHPDLSPHSLLTRLGLSLALGMVVLAGFRDAWQKDKPIFMLAAGSLSMILAGYAAWCWIGRGEQGFGGYKSYKWISFFLPWILACAMLAFREWTGKVSPMKQMGLTGAMVVLLSGNVYSASMSIQRMFETHLVVTPEMAALSRIENDPKVGSINILDGSWWHMLWETNFLMRKKLYFQSSTYAGRMASELNGEWDLARTRDVGPAAESEDIVPLNTSYYLRKRHK